VTAAVLVSCSDAERGGEMAAVAVAVVRAAGLIPRICPDVDSLTWQWSGAAAVVLDPVSAGLVSSARLPAGPDLVIVAGPADMADAWAVAGRLGAAAVVVLPGGETRLMEAMASAAAHRQAGHERVIAVTAATGGVGVSSLSVALAAALAAEGGRIGLIDLDPQGGGIDLLLGLETQAGVRWPELSDTRPADVASSLKPLLSVSVGQGAVDVLSWGRSPRLTWSATGDGALVGAVIDAMTDRADGVVVDVPARSGDVGMAALHAAGVVLLVSGRQVRAAAACSVLVRALAESSVDLRLVVGGAGPPEISVAEVASAAGVSSCAVLPHDRGLAHFAGRGELHRLPGRSALSRATRRLAAELAPSVRQPAGR
jgi:secretion/DNA translocation related CpaE-like protein